MAQLGRAANGRPCMSAKRERLGVAVEEHYERQRSGRINSGYLNFFGAEKIR